MIHGDQGRVAQGGPEYPLTSKKVAQGGSK